MKKRILNLVLALTMVMVFFSIAEIGTATDYAGTFTMGDYTYGVWGGTAIISGFNKSVSGAITIPSSLGGYPVIGIGMGAFIDCTSLTNITIPSGVTTIGSAAFQACTNLTNITIPSSVTSIEIYAFFECPPLTIRGNSGSYAETYAKNNGLKFVVDNDGYTGNSPTNSTSYGAPVVSKLYVTHSGTEYNALSQQINIEEGSSTEIFVSYSLDSGDPANVSLTLTQGVNNYVEIPPQSQIKIIPGKLFQPGKDIYLLIRDKKTGQASSKLTKLKILSKATSGNIGLNVPSGTDGVNFKLGNDIGFTIPDSIPVFGGTELGFGLDFIPLTFVYEKDDKISVVFGSNIATQSAEKDNDGKDSKIKYFKDFDFNKYKEDIKKATSKQGRTLKQVRNDYRMTNKVPLNSLKNVSGNVDVAGYAEMKYVNGKWVFSEGLIGVEAEIKYNYQGQIFIWVIPMYYEFGGGVSAGLEGKMTNIDANSFKPVFEGYLTAKIMANIGGGVGIASVATAGAEGNGSLNIKVGLNRDYTKSWVEGSANFNVKLFGKKVAEKVFAKGDFLIFETGNPNGYLKGKQAVQKNTGIFAQIDINGIYKTETRKQGETLWYSGKTQGVRLFNYTPKEANLIADNIYYEAAPKMDIINGKKFMVWSDDNLERDEFNKNMLMYSSYDEENKQWTEPRAVLDDGKADYYPIINNGWLVWHKSKELANATSTLSDIARDGEIYASKWNGSGFDTPIRLTNNAVLDTTPTVCNNGNETIVAWISNDNNDVLGISGTNSVKYAVQRNNTWQFYTADSVEKPITDISCGYINGGCYIAYTLDTDGSLDTIDDRDIHLEHNGVITNLTNDTILNSNPEFSGDMIYWYENGNIRYTNLAEIDATVFAKPVGVNDNFSVYTNQNGDTGIFWTKTDSVATEVYTAFYHDNKWSDEIKITNLGGSVKYPSGVLDESSNMSIVFNNFNSSSELAQLYNVNVTPSYNLTIESVNYTGEYIEPNSQYAAQATIKNSGELAVNGMIVSVYNEDGTLNNQYSTQDMLTAGESKEIDILFNTGELVSRETLNVTITTKNQEEYNLLDNSKSLEIGYADLVVSDMQLYEYGISSIIKVEINNLGAEDVTNVSAYLCEDSESGDVADEIYVGTIASGENVVVEFDVDPFNIEYTDGFKKYCVCFTTETEEISNSNNSVFVLLGEPESNVLIEQSIFSTNYIVETGKVAVNAIVKNTDEAKNFTMIFAVYNGEQLISTFVQNGNVEKLNETSVDGFFDSNLFISEKTYTIKTFLWSDSEKIQPLCGKVEFSYVMQ